MRSREAEFERKLAQTGLWQLPDLLQTLPDETARLTRLCYAASPAGDWLDTPPEVFFSCAAHAAVPCLCAASARQERGAV